MLNITPGIDLLEDLFQRPDEDNKRDYLFYLAIGNTKLKEYSTALKYCRALLQVVFGIGCTYARNTIYA